MAPSIIDCEQNVLVTMRMHLEDEELNTLVEEIWDRLADTLAEESLRDPTLAENGAIKGIHPHDLYKVKFVAERWGVSDDTVYRKSQGELPRANWQGSGVRFRGLEILRYEGVEIPSSRESSDQKREMKGPRSPSVLSDTREDGNTGKKYNENLPKL